MLLIAVGLGVLGIAVVVLLVCCIFKRYRNRQKGQISHFQSKIGGSVSQFPSHIQGRKIESSSWRPVSNWNLCTCHFVQYFYWALVACVQLAGFNVYRLLAYSTMWGFADMCHLTFGARCRIQYKIKSVVSGISVRSPPAQSVTK